MRTSFRRIILFLQTFFHPSRGDDITMRVEITDSILRRITFDGEACAISQARGPQMTEILTGRAQHEACKIIDDGYLTLSNPPPPVG
jgi:nitrogen fixation NifU-like protein